ncbi:hypothetical protein ACQ4PT_015244 [Festuca glaucescens]
MAAIVRSGARRLAGSALLQRAPAAGALLRWTQASGVDPFLARLMSSRMQRIQHALETPETLAKALEEIQVKEELYDLIAKSGRTDRQNRQLLKCLSVQIKPRPYDFQWRKMKALEVAEDYITSCIPMSGSVLLVLAALQVYFTDYIIAEKRKEHQLEAAAAKHKLSVAKKKKKKQQHGCCSCC